MLQFRRRAADRRRQLRVSRPTRGDGASSTIAASKMMTKSAFLVYTRLRRHSSFLRFCELSFPLSTRICAPLFEIVNNKFINTLM